MEAAIEAGAADVVSHDDGSLEVLITPDDFDEVRDCMIAIGAKPERSEITMRASTQANLQAKQAESMLKLLDVLDELDDVQHVYSNADIPEDLFEEPV